ncbi:MAG: 2,3-bisphosphoglycerate-independent phosphoglycerate mutase [Bacteroidota bacterium]
MPQKFLLMILDGWGIASQPEQSAIVQAHTPFMDELLQQYPHSQLVASGEAVGLPAGQMGNSEVGHMTLGAGRVVDQSLVRINKAMASGAFFDNPTLRAALAYAQTHQKAVHVMGLVSDGGVHAHINHLKAICQAAHDQGIDQLFVHAFTDGRDVVPQSAPAFLADLEAHLQTTTGQLASVMGRYYAMDRDQRWERTQVAYEALVHGQGERTQDWQEALEAAYAQGVTDEFLKPIVLTDQVGVPRACVQAGDVVLCFNFRTDRSRQLTQALTQPSALPEGMCPLTLHYLTMTVYDADFQGVQALFEQEDLQDTLGEVLSRHCKKQLRIAETEKYPHVTYFLSGGRERPFPGEERILCPSPQVATYDLAPEMAAREITAQVLPVLTQQNMDFICLNFANADMVGHTGMFDATVQACEVVDQCTAQVVQAALDNDYTVLIVADHGNADRMRDGQGRPYTAHSLSPVPCIWVDKKANGPLQDGTLADVAPTILQGMGLPIPSVMSGQALFGPSSH